MKNLTLIISRISIRVLIEVVSVLVGNVMNAFCYQCRRQIDTVYVLVLMRVVIRVVLRVAVTVYL